MRILLFGVLFAAGTIAGTMVARAVPDGYTLLFGAAGLKLE
jgi:hypothetical protein